MLDEFNNYRKISSANPSHRGFTLVRTALDTLSIPRVGGDHNCLVQQPMWGNLLDLLHGDLVNNGLPERTLKIALKDVLAALDYLHTECQLIHTDIKCDNILIDIEDTSVFESFTKAELEHPSPRKLVDAKAIYASRAFARPQEFGKPVLSDFGSAVSGVEVQTNYAQPVIYRAPEMMLEAGWSYPVDIWNLGALIWDMFEGRHLFYAQDPDGEGYSTRAHLAEIIALLGYPPADLLERGKRSPKFFGKDGAWTGKIEIAKDETLETCEYILEGRNQEMFLDFVRGMLTWSPEDRMTARELLRDSWLNSA
ncbi:hypothetical protein ONS95_001978 [Cadophora gregata]|uniref:uncharacterized protein n=1 Tax=Cadophora gregata TaxID=51156 RepID=UPI0026DC65C4|nr:uncharacterized protein ONS95_001978 [Cadophora gregata]KAK0111633.1 hypothetical protein ONS95_001978 [Cadophora gregata]KAK0111891.1 hypothetical protein ONS96_001159 [Cadophora gregata f. sp. sojae]